MKILIYTTFGSAILTAAVHAAPPATNDTVIHQLPDRRVIIERAPGIILPDPPAPGEKPAVEPAIPERFAEAAAKWREYRATHPFIHAGATVYKMPDGSTVTHVTNFRVNNGPMTSFWSSADFSLLAHRVSFTLAKHEHEVNYTMLLFWSHHDVSRSAEIAARRGRADQLPNIPVFPVGPATWIMDHENDAEDVDAATIRALEDIHSHYQENRDTLRAERAKLIAERDARRAELEANPPVPDDIHLRVSRLDPPQAAAWHAHAVEATTGRREIPTEKGERQ